MQRRGCSPKISSFPSIRANAETPILPVNSESPSSFHPRKRGNAVERERVELYQSPKSARTREHLERLLNFVTDVPSIRANAGTTGSNLYGLRIDSFNPRERGNNSKFSRETGPEDLQSARARKHQTKPGVVARAILQSARTRKQQTTGARDAEALPFIRASAGTTAT